MSNHLTRDFVADIEIRSDGSGRTVHGIILPYGVTARVSDGGPSYDEQFAPGAFARDIEARGGDYRKVKFLYQHNYREPLGRAVELRDDAAGVFGAFRIANTTKGDEALELLREGVLDSFSVSFIPIDPAPTALIPTDRPILRTKASLRETSLVTFPAYEGALVAGVRAIEPPADIVDGSADSTADVPPDLPLSDPDPARESGEATPLGAKSPVYRRGWVLNNLTLRSK